MTKTSGSYESVVRGVSQQVPQDRLSGQHSEQVNMVPDPVHGLARRHGSVTVAEASLAHTFADLLANTAGHRAFTFTVSGEEYDLSHRTSARPVAAALDDALFCYSRADAAFTPIVMHSTVATAALRQSGVSAIAQVGRYALMAVNNHTTTWSETPLWTTAANKSRLAVWIRGGGYSRTYKVTLTHATTGVKTTISYTTKASSYPPLLDTSAILTSNPDYQKLVNDAVNAYTGLSTEWIGQAAADIVPANIAAKLKVAYDALGFGAATVSGSTLLIENTRWGEVTVDDGGDNSLAEAVGNTIEAAEGACPVHWVGKVVKVRPSEESPESAYYLEAHAKDDVATGIASVTWREGCATRITPLSLFVLATIEGGTLYVSDDLTWMEAQIGAGATDVPDYATSKVGDTLTNVLPNFFGKQVDFLAMFQDRLIVGAGPIVSASRTGDYFNFFRASVLTMKDDDPWEIFSLGSEEDVIKHATLFNRDLILYGAKGQYAISGRVPQTSKTASIVAVSRYESAIDAVPKVGGNYAFYGTRRGPVTKKVTVLHQVQPANLTENPESVDVSQQLDGYIKGVCQELATTTSPNAVIIRTTAQRNGLYLYNYLDRSDNGQRVIDAWHRWEWSTLVGHLVGMSVTGEGDILAFVIRQGSGGASWLACEQFTLVGSRSALPYLDAQRPQAAPGSLAGLDPVQTAAAFGDAVTGAWLGGTIAQLTAGGTLADYAAAYRGVMFSSYATPTNPYPKDDNGRTITFGRMTLGTVKASVSETGGCIISSLRNGTSANVADFNGFKVGSPSSMPGVQPILNSTVQGYIGGEIRECSYTIASKRWLPLTITSIEWAGQLFNKEKRRP